MMAWRTFVETHSLTSTEMKMAIRMTTTWGQAKTFKEA